MSTGWTRVSRANGLKFWGRGPGVFVVRRAFQNLAAVDAATKVFQQIIADKRAAGIAPGDHFAKAGANDRIWNSLQKLCLRAPDIYVRYMANPIVDIACRAWLGPGCQVATQVNQVRPGGKAQAPHRDYHLGFMTPDEMALYPPHVHLMGPALSRGHSRWCAEQRLLVAMGCGHEGRHHKFSPLSFATSPATP